MSERKSGKKNPLHGEGLPITTQNTLTIKRTQVPVAEPGSTLFDGTSLETDTFPYMTTPKRGKLGTESMVVPPAIAALTQKVKLTKPQCIRSPFATFGSRRGSVGPGTSTILRKPLAGLPAPKIEATSVSQRDTMERDAIQFTEDPVAYFSRHKDGSGHKFIYLIYARSRDDHEFSPYDLIKVPLCDAGDDYFTMSATGVTHTDAEGNTEHLPLSVWIRQQEQFTAVRTLWTFKFYRFWRPFRLWRSFVMRQRYGRMTKGTVAAPVMTNLDMNVYAMKVAAAVEEGDRVISRTLVAISKHNRYSVDHYRKRCRENMERLIEQYPGFVKTAAGYVEELYARVSDEKRLEVRDSDFEEIKRRHPNMTSLVALEGKKEEERHRKEEIVKREVAYLTPFVKMFDYMFLEAQRNKCLECWEEAYHDLANDSSAVFRVQVAYSNEGKVVFVPNADELVSVIGETVDESVNTLEKLPRLILAPEVSRLFGRELNTREGQSVREMLSSSEYMSDLKEDLLQGIRDSFTEAERKTEEFNDFYELYELGEGWDPRNYLVTQDGSKYMGPLSIDEVDQSLPFDSFLAHPDKEPVINFKRLRSDVTQLKREENRVNGISMGTAAGALYVDSRNLRNRLIQIPMESLEDVEKTMNRLLSYKVDLLKNAFDRFVGMMKVECKTIDLFVDFCELLKKIESYTPHITATIDFVDHMLGLFPEYGFQKQTSPLHDMYSDFQKELDKAKQSKKDQYESFACQLRQMVYRQKLKLEKYLKNSTLIPKSVKDCDTEVMKQGNEKLKRKLEQCKEPISKLIRFQDILDFKTNHFETFQDAKANAEFMDSLVDILDQFKIFRVNVEETPFAEVDMTEFSTEIESFGEKLAKMSDSWNKPSGILRDISDLYQIVNPYVHELCLLHGGKMQLRHWKILFDRCNMQKAYSPDLTISDLANMGLLEKTDEIKKITHASLGEFKLDAEFREISEHLENVHIPLAEPQIKTETSLIIEPLGKLFADVDNNFISLCQLLCHPCVAGIRDKVLDLAKKLNRTTLILKAWQPFQAHWIIVSTLFKQAAIRNMFPNKQSMFSHISKKWSAIVQHVRSNTRLLAVCSYETLLEDLEECNSELEMILLAVKKYIDDKRKVIPRFYYLSDDEVLTLLATPNFEVFANNFVKVLAHIARVESRRVADADVGEQDAMTEICNFHGLQIYGTVGEDGDILLLPTPVMCAGPMESWIPSFFNSLQQAFKEELVKSLKAYEGTSLNDWVLPTSSYVAMVTLRLVFERTVQECFDNFDTNPRGLALYEGKLKDKLTEVSSILSTPLSPQELYKVSNVIIHLNHFLEILHKCQEKMHGYSHKFAWETSLRYSYQPNIQQLNIECGDSSIPHGGEFWGMCPRIVLTSDAVAAAKNIAFARIANNVPMLYASPGSGKKLLLDFMAAFMGKFIYHAYPFPDTSPVLMMNMIIGTMESGSWLSFLSVDRHGFENESILFDIIRKVVSSQQAHLLECEIAGRQIKIDRSAFILMTTTLSAIQSHAIAPHLRSFVRPISLIIPSAARLVEVSLASNGFKSSKHIGRALVDCLFALVRILSLPRTTMSYCFTVVNRATRILSELAHGATCSFLSYYDQMRASEEYSVAKATYDHFMTSLKAGEIDILVQVLYANFPLFSCFEAFKDHITAPTGFKINKVEQFIGNFLQDKIAELDLDLPAEYLIQKTIDLFKLFQEYSVIFICGQPKTGKSLVLKLLSFAYEALAEESDATQFKGMLPLKIVEVFCGSGTKEDVFGRFDIKRGRWVYGRLQAAISCLTDESDSVHRVLHVDGPVDRTIADYFIQAGKDERACRLASMDSWHKARGMHIVVETGDISSLSPAVCSACGILPMTSCQTVVSQIENSMGLDLIHPTVPFSAAAVKFQPHISEETMSLARSLYCDYSPTIMKQIQHTPTVINLLPFVGHLAEDAATFMFRYIVANDLGSSLDRQLLKIALMLGFYKSVCGVLDLSQTSLFDQWLVKTFQLEMPNEWIGFSVPDIFWDAFPHPSLESTRIHRGKLAPVNHTLLKEEIRKQNGSPVVIHPLYLPIVNTVQLCILNNQHILIHGDEYSGKETLMKIIAEKFHGIIPIDINVTSLTTPAEIEHVILSQSELASREMQVPDDTSTYCLVLHHMDSGKPEIFEFVRMLVKMKCLYFHSNLDPRTYVKRPTRRFIVVASVRSLANLDPRFLACFTVMHSMRYTDSVKQLIIRQTLGDANVVPKVIQIVTDILLRLGLDMNMLMRLLQTTCVLPERSNEDSILYIFSVFMSEVRTFCFFSNSEAFEQFCDEVRELCVNYGLEDMFKKFKEENARYIPSYDTRSEITIWKYDHIAMKEKLTKLAGHPLSNNVIECFGVVSSCLQRPKSNCLIYGPSCAGKYTAIKLFAAKNRVRLTDMSFCHTEGLKKAVKEALLMRRKQLIVLRYDPDDLTRFEFLHSVLIEKELGVLFDHEELDEMARTVTRADVDNEKQRNEAYKVMKDTLELYCSFVIVSDTYLKIPNFEQVEVKEQTKENLCEELIPPDLQHTAPLLISISNRVEETLRNSNSNMFYDLVTWFVETLTEDTQKLVSKNEKLKMSLEFYEEISKESKKLKDEMDSLLPKLERMKKDNDSRAKDFAQKHSMIDAKRSKLTEESIFKNAELNQKKKDLTDLEMQLSVIRPKIATLFARIDHATEDEMQEMRVYGANATPAVTQVTQLICVLTRAQHDITILSDQGLPLMLKERLNYKALTPEAVHAAKVLLREEGIEKAQRESWPEMMRVVFKLCKKVTKAAAMFQSSESKRTEIVSHEKDVVEFEATLEKEMGSIREIEESMTQQSKDIEESQVALERMHQRFRKLSEQMEAVDNVLRDLSLLVTNWQEEAQTFQHRMKTMKGDCLTYAAYMTYCGGLTAEERSNVITIIIDALLVADVPTSFDDPIESISERLAGMDLKDITENVLLPRDVIVDLYHLLLAKRIPLLIDCDRFVTDILKKTEGLVMCSMKSSEFEPTVMKAFKDGLAIMIFDVDETNELVRNLLGNPDSVNLDGERVLRNKNFKMILSAKSDEMPTSFLSRVTVIRPVSSSLHAVRTAIIHTFVDYFDPDLMPRLSQVDKAEALHKKQLVQYQESALEKMAFMAKARQEDKNYAYLDDNATIAELCSAKDCYLVTIGSTVDSAPVHKELELTIKQYVPLIDMCQAMWVCLSRYVPRFSDRVFSFSAFLKVLSNVFVNAGIRSPTLSNDQLVGLKNSLTVAIFQFAFPSMNYRSIMAFLFISAFLMTRHVDEKDLNQIIEHIYHEFDGKCSFAPFAIENTKTLLENLKYTNVENIFSLIDAFVTETFGRDYANYFPFLQVEKWVPSSPSTPVLLLADPSKDPTELICHYIALRNKQESFMSLTLLDNQVDVVRKLLLECMETGKYLLVHYVRPSLTCAQLLNEVVSLLETNSVHEGFGLMINCHTTEHLGRLLFEASRVIQIECFPSMRHSMLELYHYHAASLKTFDAKPNMKRLAYLTALIYSQLLYRNFLRPIGFNTFSGLSVWGFSDVLSYIRTLFEENQLCLKNLCEMLDLTVFGARVPEINDREKVRTMIGSMITPDCLEDHFVMIDPASPEVDKWFIPRDTSLAIYQQRIQRLPVFATTDILLMSHDSSMTLRNWNLSRYFAKAFVKLHKADPPKLDGGPEAKLRVQLPVKIDSCDEPDVTPLVHFWNSEINIFNEFITSIQQDLNGRVPELYRGEIPRKWQRYHNTHALTDFVQHLKARRAFLVACSKEVEPRIIDSTMVYNPAGFMHAYLATQAFKKSGAVSLVTYEFEFVEEVTSGFGISGLYMGNGDIVDGLLVKSDKPYNRLPILQCKVVMKEIRTVKLFMCPMYVTVFESDIVPEGRKAIDVNETENFVWEVPLQSEQMERMWILNGTCIYWQMPSQCV